MKFSIDKDALIVGLQQVMNVVGSRLTMPILSNVLIEAEGKKIALSTTCLDIGIRCCVSAQVEQPGSVTLPAKKLASIVKSFAEKTITFSSSGELLVNVSCGSSRFKLPSLNVEEFPNLPQLDVEQNVEINQMQFARMLKSISYAQSKDENRYLLHGVYFSLEAGKLNFIAADGRRLALIASEIPGCSLEKGVVVPAKTIAELERTLGIGENVRVIMTEKQIAFLLDVAEDHGITDSIYIVSKIVEGNYLNYKQVIPSALDYRVRIDREQLLSVIQRISLVADDKKYSVKLVFEDNALEISAQSEAYGEAREVIPVAYSEERKEIAFNPQFLSDPLKVLTNDEIYFEFKNEFSPGVIKTNDTFLYVIMPLRLN